MCSVAWSSLDGSDPEALSLLAVAPSSGLQSAVTGVMGTQTVNALPGGGTPGIAFDLLCALGM